MTDTPDLTNQLLPCPFCGGADLKVWANSITCENKECGAHGPETYVGNVRSAFEKIMEPGYAGRAWNRRDYAGDGSKVRIPTSADEAAMMCLLGERYLKENAPERLKGEQKETKP